MPTPTITVNYTVTTFPGNTFKLHVTTVGAVMPSEIFAIEVLPLSADPLNTNLRFSHVCNYSELLEFPDVQTAEDAYFRTADIELIFDNSDMLQKAVRNILADAERLKLDYAAVNADPATVTGETHTVTF